MTKLVGGLTPTCTRSRAADVRDERPEATVFERLVFLKHGLVMNDAVLMEPLTGVPGSMADVPSAGKLPADAERGKEALAREQAQAAEATASTLRHEAVSGAVAATFCAALRRWGGAAAQLVDAAGGCGWLLKLLHARAEAWQHAGASLLELYAATSHGRARLALRVRFPGNANMSRGDANSQLRA